MNIRFSILMPAYNREKYVRQSIRFYRKQDFELLVIDDGSTDKTLRCPNPMAPASRCFDKAIKARRSPATKAAAMAEGEYLVLLDSDDLLLRSALATYDRIIRSFDSPPLITGAMTDFQDGQSIAPESGASLPVKALKFSRLLVQGCCYRQTHPSLAGAHFADAIASRVPGLGAGTPG